MAHPAGAAIVLEGLRKDYGGFTAVHPLDLTVAYGEVFAFLGPNGAGKTTTIRMLTGLLPPTAGRALVAGHDVWQEPRAAKRSLGYVPDTPVLHELLTAREFLWFMADLYGLPHGQGRERAAVLLDLLQLTPHADKLVRDFSLGMKRKLAIAAALIHDPQVLLLDEPTNGLDARAAREVKDLIARWARQGRAVFLTTHILSVVEELAHRIGLLHRGRLVAVGTRDELARLAGRPGAGLEEIFLALTGDAVDLAEEEEPARGPGAPGDAGAGTDGAAARPAGGGGAAAGATGGLRGARR